MKIAVCEDHKEEAGWLKSQIEYWGSHENIPVSVALYENAEQFWFDYGLEKAFDVLLLDIEMPGESGISLAKRLRAKNDDIPVIFVTGVDDYMSDGYDVQAIHYLLKPVNKNKLKECLTRIYEKQKNKEPCVLLNTTEGLVKLLQKDILKIESFSRYCIYTTLNHDYQVSISLKDAFNELQKDRFAFSHRGILINLCHVETITHEQVTLSGGHTALVSRRQYGDLNKAFISFYHGGGK